MRTVLIVAVACVTFGFVTVPPARSAGSPPADFQPDPKSVQRYGAAYRYPQAGWVVLHIEGEPYERGYQHGRLMADDIAAHLRCMAATQNSKTPNEGWKQVRILVNALFVRRYEKEFLEEMKGIAEGANAAGAKIFDRQIDLVDIVALNSWPEIETLPYALEATPTGLEGKLFPKPDLRSMPTPKPMHCSAFAATGPATADGKIVFGHITMFSLYPSHFYNVWLDVKPAKGHRVFMQSYPGGIQSGMDYYYNDAGLLVCETTIAQTKFDIKGMTVASRIRQALQYADSIDKAVEILGKENNGLYTNEWLLGDIKTNEIAMYELGTAKSRLYRSSKNEWFGGTEGFYWGCNNTKDLDVRLETIASVEGKPANPVFRPSPREKEWMRLYNKHKGKIGVEFGKEAFTTPIIAASHSLDAKFTTTDLAKDLKTWALFGPPLGKSWQPTQEERQRFADIQPLASNPWTVLHARAPANESGIAAAVDLGESKDRHEAKAKSEDDEGDEDENGPAWRGTVLPKTNADIWLATAFADYERYYSLEKSLRHASEGALKAEDRDRLAAERCGHLSHYKTGARALGDITLAKTHTDPADDSWYRVAAGKGFWLMHELRQTLGNEAFEEAMQSFGKENAGKAVTTEQFRKHLEKVGKKPLEKLFAEWTEQTGLPHLRLGGVKSAQKDGQYLVSGEIHLNGAKSSREVELALETDGDEVRKRVTVEPGKTTFSLESTSTPKRVIVDKYGLTAKVNGGAFSIESFHSELDQTLIVYGTGEEGAANREAAETLQKAIVTSFWNLTVPIRSDREVTEQELKSHHLLLIGRPDCNAIVEKYRDKLPIQFGSRSFVARGESYANAGSAVIAAAENPANPRYSVVVIAGLGAASTLSAAPRLVHEGKAAEVLVLPKGKPIKALVIPAPELVAEIEDATSRKANTQGPRK
jgi:hypothetical protein